MDDSENPRTTQEGDGMVWMTDEGSPNYPEERGSVGREDEWTWEIFRRLQEQISLIHSSRALGSSMCQGRWVCQMVAGFWRMTKSQSREQGEKGDPSKGAACTKVAEACPETRAHDGAGWGEKRDREAWIRPQKAGLLLCLLQLALLGLQNMFMEESMCAAGFEENRLSKETSQNKVTNEARNEFVFREWPQWVRCPIISSRPCACGEDRSLCLPHVRWCSSLSIKTRLPDPKWCLLPLKVFSPRTSWTKPREMYVVLLLNPWCWIFKGCKSHHQ